MKHCLRDYLIINAIGENDLIKLLKSHLHKQIKLKQVEKEVYCNRIVHFHHF